jgi:hypothetical protein
MVMMVIKCVLLEKRLCQDLTSQSLVFENLPARGAWVCGCAHCARLWTGQPPKNSVDAVLAGHRKAPGSLGRGRMGRTDGRILFILCLGEDLVWLEYSSSFLGGWLLLFSQEWWGHIHYRVCGSPNVCY